MLVPGIGERRNGALRWLPIGPASLGLGFQPSELGKLAVVVLSQYVQHSYVADLLDFGGGRGVGYLLKDRVGDVEEFISALRRVCEGGTVVDPEVISQLLRRRRDPLPELSAREREVLALMAEGQSNAAIARQLFVSEAAIGKHVGNILFKLRLPQTDDTNRRVLAVLAYLRGKDPA